jgi:hypothetical protein
MTSDFVFGGLHSTKRPGLNDASLSCIVDIPPDHLIGYGSRVPLGERS